ncbi:serine threonine- kinase Nek10 [Pelobates cultripes]|uniref:Serine threonine- kinase Nek10 n=1 Tax=Pelobates cultripes TaxID=61616 RepID=A0AAD1RX62_PELCU|nr:serine threonine- kinase Nek10 [Pelobates cultripes]
MWSSYSDQLRQDICSLFGQVLRQTASASTEQTEAELPPVGVGGFANESGRKMEVTDGPPWGGRSRGRICKQTQRACLPYCRWKSRRRTTTPAANHYYEKKRRTLLTSTGCMAPVLQGSREFIEFFTADIHGLLQSLGGTSSMSDDRTGNSNGSEYDEGITYEQLQTMIEDVLEDSGYYKLSSNRAPCDL